MYAQTNPVELNQMNASQRLESLAGQLYDKAKGQGLLAKLKKLFSKFDVDRLVTLDELTRHIRIQGQKSGGLKKVAIKNILGTAAEGRSCDFDINFRPLQEHNKERWLKVAAAWISGRRLGHVKLLQVGDVFFVEDGHHRISVAKAMGEEEIEANIVILLGTGKLSMPPQVEGIKAFGGLALRPATA